MTMMGIGPDRRAALKLGSFAMPLHPPGSNFSQTLADDLDQIIVADQLGLSEYWIGEHFTAEWENIPAPDLLIAQALGVTKNIILGTGVSCLPNHHPFVLAHRIAQLDHMAKSRLHWGVAVVSRETWKSSGTARKGATTAA